MNDAHGGTDDGPVTLQHIERPGLSSWLTAEIDESGDLVLAGRDRGVGAGHNGAGHDYRITVAAGRLPSLSEALHGTMHDGHHGTADLLTLLASAFATGTFSSAQEFRSWAHRAGIDSSLDANL